ncbi:hypothetical protein SDC9_43977 [bioreactor metagenome]|uniref:MacB-like periplasmic core domain-containing protein n=1 Tax=bioreactor metagenome TaxID=1076179 RepID=A0A644W509_9ZZZZ
MSASIAISVIMFLGFHVFIDFMYTNLKTTKPYTPDISLTAEDGLGTDLYSELSELEGVKCVYGRMFGYVSATFDASRLTDTYKEAVGPIDIGSDGLFTPPEKSWLISYDANQFKWAKADLIGGTLSEEQLNNQNGIVAVLMNIRKGVSMETAGLALGDKVYIDTAAGKKEFTVMAVLRTVPFADSNLNLTTFITTEKQYAEITGDSTLKIIESSSKSKIKRIQPLRSSASSMIKSPILIRGSRTANSIRPSLPWRFSYTALWRSSRSSAY